MMTPINSMKLYITNIQTCKARQYIPIRVNNIGIAISLWEQSDIAFVFRFYKQLNQSYELGDIWIHPKNRSKFYKHNLKYSTLLMTLVSKIINETKMKYVWLWTLANNEKSISLYKKHGFIMVKIDPTKNEAIRKNHRWINDKQPIIQMELSVKN